MNSLLAAVITVTFFWDVEAGGGGEAIDPAIPEILPMRERAEIRDEWLEKRLDTVVPGLMRREGVDMWVLVAREYNEDPVVRTMLPATWLNARRRTILVFHDPGEGAQVERFAVSRYAVGDFFKAAWVPEEEPDQWKRLADLIAELDPERIALNRSVTYALADGLTESQYTELNRSLPEKYRSRIVSGERLAIGWLETRIPEEMAVYPTIVRIAHAIIAEGLSEKVITPGETTADDVMWWYRDRIQELGLVTWFHPSVSIQRNEGAAQGMTELFADENARTIQFGDLLHVDFGITYLGLNTDTQHHAYVLKPGESNAPDGIRAGLAAANRLQDIFTAEFKTGDSGNEVLARARQKAIADELTPSIYTHPLGFHGHGAGATIGLWDQQGGVPGRGDYPVMPDTAWSIELNVSHPIPEWDGQIVRFMLEEDAFFDGEAVSYLDGRQTELHLIPRPRS